MSLTINIVTPSYEKHFVQYNRMIESFINCCDDIDSVNFTIIIEKNNEELFSSIFKKHSNLKYSIIFTEDVLERFGVTETPIEFLRNIGKFTFQTLKKFGGLEQAPTAWSLVLDSECLFHNPFSAAQLLQDYQAQKYVFYTRTQPRGEPWHHSLGSQVNANTSAVLDMNSSDRWYMEYFHWFYETEKVKDLINNHLNSKFYDAIRGNNKRNIDFFENILYYNYIEKFHSDEYNIIDLKQELDRTICDDIAARFKLNEMPFSRYGNDYLLNIVAPDEVHFLARLFEKYKLPFIRLEPPFFDRRYFEALKRLPHFVATISSHHQMWLRKRVAVCISGEFRHTIDRTPEHQVRNIQAFLSATDCDIFVHGWSNTSEALILHELKPRAYKFEAAPSVGALVRRIRQVEPNIKPGRDEGSLKMFYSLQGCYDLVEPYIEDYDYIVRIRPDVFNDRSLKEIMVSISDHGDFLPDAIYFPQHFHSKGINDQFALGSTKSMAIYLQTYDFIERNIDELPFNPESVLLRNLIENKVDIALVDMPYALMRHHQMRIEHGSDTMRDQRRVWWSRTDRLPLLQNVSDYFADKLRATEDILTGTTPRVCYIESDGIVMRARNIDNDPSLSALAFIPSFFGYKIAPATISDGKIQETVNGRPDTLGYLFVFREEDNMIVSKWRLDGNAFENERLKLPLGSLYTKAPLPRWQVLQAWMKYRIKNMAISAVLFLLRCTKKIRAVFRL